MSSMNTMHTTTIVIALSLLSMAIYLVLQKKNTNCECVTQNCECYAPPARSSSQTQAETTKKQFSKCTIL